MLLRARYRSITPYGNTVNYMMRALRSTFLSTPCLTKASALLHADLLVCDNFTLADEELWNTCLGELLSKILMVNLIVGPISIWVKFGDISYTGGHLFWAACIFNRGPHCGVPFHSGFLYVRLRGSGFWTQLCRQKGRQDLCRPGPWSMGRLSPLGLPYSLNGTSPFTVEFKLIRSFN